MQRSAGQRTAAILLAMVAQGLFVALYVLPHGQEAAKQAEIPALVFIQPLDTPRILPLRPRRNERDAGIHVTPAISVAPPAESVESSNPVASVESNAITVSPPSDTPQINWHEGLATALQESAKRLAEKELENPLDSNPDVLELPDVPPPKPVVRMDRLANGDVITRHRLSDNREMVCEHLQKPLSARFDVTWHRLPMCSKPYRISTGLEGIDSLKPGYLSKPVPTPRPAQAAGKESRPTDALP
jgi:hypothetical protein